MPPREYPGVIPDNLVDLKDVDESVTLEDGFTISYDAARKMWVPAAPAAGGGALQSWIWVDNDGSGLPLAVVAGDPVASDVVVNQQEALHGTDLSWASGDAGNIIVHTPGVYFAQLLARWSIANSALPTAGVIALLVGGSQPDVQDYSAHFPPGIPNGAIVAGSVSGVLVFDEAAMTGPGGTGNIYFGVSNYTDKTHAFNGADVIVTRLA